MRKQARAAASLMVAGVVLAGCGTAPPDESEIEDSESDESAETGDDDDANSDADEDGADDGDGSPPLEVDVIEEFEDEPWSVAANYDEASEHVDVTIFAEPDALSDEELDDIEQRVTEVSGAKSVNVVVSDEEVPDEN